MSKHCIIELKTIDDTRLFLDATRIESVLQGNKAGEAQIVTSSDTYNVRAKVEDAVKQWKDAL